MTFQENKHQRKLYSHTKQHYSSLFKLIVYRYTKEYESSLKLAVVPEMSADEQLLGMIHFR